MKHYPDNGNGDISLTVENVWYFSFFAFKIFLFYEDDVNQLAYYKTRNTGTTEHGTPAEHRNAGETPEHWQMNGTLTEQSEYHGISL